ncbi:hypothetical protein BKA65DRAFT_570474 [Rhexocercosporidium sp. MPI-PUGE-AT-0058]|nr:hypothetical protein BKA65DRAFT_570474 [Rhexocercosporidium sp. MPI-PUGE-AT-0058]
MAAIHSPTSQPLAQPDTQDSEKASIIGIVINARNGLLKAFSFGLQEPEPDLLEKWLQTDPSHKHYLLQDYKRIKLSPGKEIVDRLTKYYVFDALTFGSTANTSEMNHEMNHSERSNLTLSHALDNFCTKLQTGSDPSLRICVLSLKLSESLRSGLFKFQDKAFCSIEQLNDKYDVFSRSILSLIQKEWDPSLDRSKSWINDPFSQDISPPQRSFKLPSKVAGVRNFCLLNERNQRNTIQFTLMSTAPSYRSDFYEYIWQRQNQRPPQDTIIFSTSETDVLGSKNVLITIDSERESANGTVCARIMYEFDQHFKTVLPLPSDDHTPCSMESAFLGALFAVFMVLAESTNNYINSVSQSISKLCYEGRRRPSGSKLHYLSHLEDSRKLAADSVQDALTLLAEVEVPITNSPAVKPLNVQFSDIETDMKFLKDKLEDVEKQLAALQVMLKEKLDLRQIRRTYILTVLAAIYLPFSLMTSFYGMNVSDPIWPSSKSDPTKDSSPNTAARNVMELPGNSSTFSTEQTSAIVSAIQSSGSHLWTFQSYWYTTVPVTVATIIIPMIIGVIFRSLSRFAFYYRGYWRLIVISGLLVFVAMSDIFMNVLSYTADFYATIWLAITTALLGLSAVVLICRAFMKKRHRLIWCGFAVSVAIYPPIWWYNFDYFSSYLSIFVPFTYLLLVWFRHDFRDLFLKYRAYRRRHASSQNLSTVAEEGQIQPPQNVAQGDPVSLASGAGNDTYEHSAAVASPSQVAVQIPQGAATGRNARSASDTGLLARVRSTPTQPPDSGEEQSVRPETA